MVDWIAEFMKNIELTQFSQTFQPGEIISSTPKNCANKRRNNAGHIQGFPKHHHAGNGNIGSTHAGLDTSPQTTAHTLKYSASSLAAAIGAQCMVWKTSPLPMN